MEDLTAVLRSRAVSTRMALDAILDLVNDMSATAPSSEDARRLCEDAFDLAGALSDGATVLELTIGQVESLSPPGPPEDS